MLHRLFGPVVITAILAVVPHAAFAYWPPLQDVQLSRSGDRITVRVFDPSRGTWMERTTDTCCGGTISNLGATNGVVAWQRGDKVYCETYDPQRGAWIDSVVDTCCASSGNTNLIVASGVAAWMRADKVHYETYDPALGSWISASTDTCCTTGSNTALANQDGVVTWLRGDTVYYDVYDPARMAWIGGVTNTCCAAGTNSAPVIAGATVTWSRGTTAYIRGYDHDSGSWTNQSTTPFAFAAGFPLAGNPPLYVFFTDMSIGTWSWNWTFGDGASSASRSPAHIFVGSGRFIVTENGAFDLVVTTQTTPLAAPTNLIATYGGATVALSWNGVTGADHYEVARRGTGTIGTPATNAYTDPTVAPNMAYVYEVRAVAADGSMSAYGNADLATTITFIDDPLTPGRRILAVHLTQLRQAVDAVRSAAALPPAAVTDANPAGVPVKALHVQELRTALAEARAAIGLSPASFSNSLVPGQTLIRAVDFIELRSAVK